MDQELKFTQDKFIKHLARLEYFTYLTSANKSTLSECIQYISEALVWSDQNHHNYFNQFKFNNTQMLFTKLLKESNSKDLSIQLIQSANIFIHNLDTAEHKCKKYSAFLLASDFFTALVSTDFDFSDDEITENFISFLKGLAANLSSELLLTYAIHTKFQVFTQSFKFFFHPDAMIRNGARTSILTIIKRIFYLVKDSNVFSFLLNFEFTSKILKKIMENWQKLYNDLTCGDKLLIENSLLAISDDLMYLNDLMEHVEELVTEISTKFLCLAVPWIIKKITEVLENGDTFIPVGWVLNCILDNIKGSSVLDVLVTSLFAGKISEKVKGYMIEDTLHNNQFSYCMEENENENLENTVKHQVISLLNEPYSATALLLIVNKIVSNTGISKRTLYDCALLPKDEIKTQMLLRKVLQDKLEYMTDPLLSEFLMQIFLGEQSTFNTILSGRIISLCRLHPEEKYMQIFQNNLNTQIIIIISNLLEFLANEKFQELVLEAFELESEAVKKIKLETKIEYPVEILNNIETLIPLNYRLPISKKEVYHWNFSKLFTLNLFENFIFGLEKFKNIEQMISEATRKGGVVNIECENAEGIKIDDFNLTAFTKNGVKVVKLRNVEVMLDNKTGYSFDLIANDGKATLNSKMKFWDEELCKNSKKIIEMKRKESKNKEMVLIKEFLVMEKAKRTAFSNSF